MKFDDGTGDPHLGGQFDDAPQYVVSFWTPSGSGWAQAWEILRDADGDQVLAWAKENAKGRHYSIWTRTVYQDLDGSLGSDGVRLIGTDPPRNGSEPAWAKRPTA